MEESCCKRLESEMKEDGNGIGKGGKSEEKDLQMIVERGMKWNCIPVM